MIKLIEVFKTYKVGDGVVRAVDGVSLHIEKGTLAAITGASGSGKTTLLNILGCLDVPDSGRYLLAGEDISKLSRNRLSEIRNKRIGFVFQTFNLLPRTTAIENVELPLLYAGKSKAKEYAKKALEIVGLQDRIYHQSNKLSGGERQRVAIARAIVNNPDIILADEPTGNLDSKTGSEIIKLFEKLNKEGQTIIIVTHDMEVASHCHIRIQMRDGKIV